MSKAVYSNITRDMPTSSVCGERLDLVGDKRSVQAFLAGNGDLRQIWWKMFRAVHQCVARDSTLEWAMFAFHNFHHRITLGRLEFLASVCRTAGDVEDEGILSAARKSFMRELNR